MRPTRPATGWTPSACLVLAMVCLLVFTMLAACGLTTDAPPVDTRPHPVAVTPSPAPATATPAPTLAPAPRASRSRAPAPRRAAARADRGRSSWADVTAYCLRGTMANGRPVHVGAVASLARIPFGTRVRIAGVVYTVEDRVGHGTAWDVWMPSCAEARRWGRKRLHVEVLP